MRPFQAVHGDSGCFLAYFPHLVGLYLLTKHSTCTSGSLPQALGKENGIHLETGERVTMPRDVDQYRIRDDNIDSCLNLLPSSGIIHPYKCKPDHPIPLHGNLSAPRWISVNVGGSCNRKCKFCYTDWTREFPDFSTGELESVLKNVARIPTVTSVVFTGGEPTIRSDLIRLVRFTRGLGFNEISLQTNGSALAVEEYTSSLKEAGLTNVLISLHGTKARTHDSLTGVQGSYKQALRAIEYVSRYNIAIILNFVVTPMNYDEIDELPQLVSQVAPNSSRIRISYPIIEGAAFDNLSEVLLSFKNVTPRLQETYDRCKSKRLRLETGTMPLCVGLYPSIDSTYTMRNLKSFVEVSPFYMHNIQRGEISIKFEGCRSCGVFSLCRGIQLEYIKMFPSDYKIFEPIMC